MCIGWNGRPGRVSWSADREVSCPPRRGVSCGTPPSTASLVWIWPYGAWGDLLHGDSGPVRVTTVGRTVRHFMSEAIVTFRQRYPGEYGAEWDRAPQVRTGIKDLRAGEDHVARAQHGDDPLPGDRRDAAPGSSPSRGEGSGSKREGEGSRADGRERVPPRIPCGSTATSALGTLCMLRFSCRTGGLCGGEVGPAAVKARWVAPSAAGVAGDVNADFDDQLGPHQCDGQRFPAAPAGGERPAGPGVAGGAAGVRRPAIEVPVARARWWRGRCTGGVHGRHPCPAADCGVR